MTLFFDMDDTLYDRGLPFMEAAEEFLGGKVKDLREAYRCCTSRGNEVFLPSQRGEITMDEMYIYRWGKGFGDIGIEITEDEALAFQALYRIKQDDIKLTGEIEKMLKFLSEASLGLGVISNGPSDKQWNKIQRLGIECFTKHDMIIISGDIGIDKPDHAVFHLAEERSSERPENLIYVGDSLKNDIIPASDCGWHTIWFNREAKLDTKNDYADIIVKTEEELALTIEKIVNGECR